MNSSIHKKKKFMYTKKALTRVHFMLYVVYVLRFTNVDTILITIHFYDNRTLKQM